MPAALAVAVFVVGVVIVVWATEEFLQGLVGVAAMLGVSTFATSAVLSGLEAENVAVGLASGANGLDSVALGSVYGGAVFLVCVALGLGAIIYPLRVRLPRSILLLFLATPIVAGLGVSTSVLQRPIGGLLLLAFFLGIGGLVLFGRGQSFFESEALEEVERKRPSRARSVALTLVGLAAVALGGELVAKGAEGLLANFPIPPLLMGMVIAPAVIELEEVVRQAVPAREGRPEVAAGNLVGTLLYFLFFNLGLIAVATPVPVQPVIRSFDWPFSVGVTALATIYLWRGGVSRLQGFTLLIAYAGFIAGHIVLG